MSSTSSKSKSSRRKISKKKSKKSYSKSNNLKSLKTVVITSSNRNNFFPNSELDINPRIWELPNRKKYYNWFYSVFNQYKIGEKLGKTPGNIQLFRIQRLVKNFFQERNPTRGILLYHGLGLGKSCAAISIAEANNRDVIFLSKASLEPNFVYEIKKCGASYMRTSNYWVFCKCLKESEKELASHLRIPTKIIKENGGCFFIDFTSKQKPNYDGMNEKQKQQLTKQLESTIYARFTFLHLDDTRLTKKIKEGDFDNKLIIVDEVHNLTNSMTNETVVGSFFYKFMMEAKNSKFVFLSGTPLINSVFESSRIFNILRGYIPTLIYKIITNPSTVLNWSAIKSKLGNNEYVDQIIIDKTRKTIKITKNPDNYVNSRISIKKDSSSKQSSKKVKNIWNGIRYSPEEDISFDEFRSDIDRLVGLLGKDQKFSVKYNFENNTCLPEEADEFEQLFYNSELNKLKNKDIIKKRINGISSYYHKIVDKSEFPELKFVKVVAVPMSDYQLGKYKQVRTQEINVEKKKARRVKNDQFKSSFRIYSRLFCSFIFPDEVGSPYDKNNINIMEKMEDIEDLEKAQLSMSLKKEKIGEKEYKRNAKENAAIIKHFMNIMNERKEEFLNEERLSVFSPKYVSIIENINRSKGSNFLYSQFINLVGLKMFCYALEAYTRDFFEFKLVKVGQKYRLDKSMFYDEESDNDELLEERINMRRYMIYAGSETDKETKEVMRLIFNSDYESLPPSCNFLIKELNHIFGPERNKYGKIINLFMTTRTGAEGISLMNVRQVHIMEPYWQPVLIDQVIGRARRMSSHKALKPHEQNVEVYLYMATFAQSNIKDLMITALKKDLAPFKDGLNKKGKLITSDEFLYIISERKKKIIDEFNLLIMGSSFDCTLNYEDNIRKEPRIICSDYNTSDRDEYLFTPNVEDTIDAVEIQQEYIKKVNYMKIAFPRGSNKFFYIVQNPQPGERRFLYSQEILSKVGSKPVGEIVVRDGKKKIVFFKKKSQDKGSKSSKSKRSKKTKKKSIKKSRK